MARRPPPVTTPRGPNRPSIRPDPATDRRRRPQDAQDAPVSEHSTPWLEWVQAGTRVDAVDSWLEDVEMSEGRTETMVHIHVATPDLTDDLHIYGSPA